VAKPVFASTSVTAVNLDSSRAKESTPQPCYPDVCFAVDNFDDAFEDLVRAQRRWCCSVGPRCSTAMPAAGTSKHTQTAAMHSVCMNTWQQHHRRGRPRVL
jgi:hypothetical protein